MADKIKNCFLINAPAGSGKTTKIKAMIQKCIVDGPKNNVLCITYTNRAADELSTNIDARNVFVGTIHSFLHNFMKRYFRHPSILDLYFEIYGDRIKHRIENIKQDKHIVSSNDKYIEKYGKLDYETVRENIMSISYNESPFSALYYGGLSHDDLIGFSKAVFDRYPIIRERISAKYQFIFIDEYQDTMADVLKVFFESVAHSSTQLYLFGDRMQQIYRNYDGSFEKEFESFDTTKFLSTNYRSATEIVEILNKIYNDESFIQTASSEMKSTRPKFQPRIIICDCINDAIDDIKQSDPDTLVLYLLNKERFTEIGALNLYQAFDDMEKYSFGKAYSAVTVLTESYESNPDSLMRLLYCIANIVNYYQMQQYGLIVQILKANKSMFDESSWHIRTHSDKQILFSKLNKLFAAFYDETKSITDILVLLMSSSFVNASYMESIQADEDNKIAFNVPAVEVIRVAEYLRNPKVSTQHGVKGESHDSVVFVADDSNISPIVHMYRFFEMWAQFPISLSAFNQFYYAYIDELSNLESAISMKISDLNKESYIRYEYIISQGINAIVDKFKGNLYFDFLCLEKYGQFLSKPGVTKAKDCLKSSMVFGSLSAYKLFYVGCSRARRNLTILLDRSKIKGKLELQKMKFAEIGFDVQ